MSDFSLHPNLVAAAHFAADWPLCRLLLATDARYPWLVLVPRRPDIVEITDLVPADRLLLWEEVERACRAVQAMDGVTKLNIGALGNNTAQFHFHVIGRHQGDPAWPGPVWGHSKGESYDEAAREARLALVRAC